MIETKKTITPRRPMLVALSFFFAVCALGTAAPTAQGGTQDRVVSLKQAETLAIKAKSKTDFPVVVNELVLEQLNYFMGTPQGRQFMKEALQRMPNYTDSVDPALISYGLPEELRAVPIIESGYDNLPQSQNAGWGAGLWMFIEESARNYGLKVNDHVDERMNVALETDAAMRYLKSSFLRFKDWNLALLAYNWGEGAVQEAIRTQGTRDAWTLARLSAPKKRRYLPMVMAAVLIMANPETLN